MPKETAPQTKHPEQPEMGGYQDHSAFGNAGDRHPPFHPEGNAQMSAEEHGVRRGGGLGTAPASATVSRETDAL